MLRNDQLLEEEELWLAINQDKTKGEDLKAAEKQKTLCPGQQAERELLSNQRAVVEAHSCFLLKSSSSKEVQEVSFESSMFKLGIYTLPFLGILVLLCAKFWTPSHFASLNCQPKHSEIMNQPPSAPSGLETMRF